jgi:Tol biopolymer transport system component/DNA-binding winged helix-turn-helix (wHTH) protein
MEMTPSSTPEIPHLSSIRPFRIGEWLVSPALCRVTRRGETTHLEPRVMSLLACLASRPGQVFSRDALLGAIWPDVVVNEEALTRAISELRRALEDDPRDSRIIETIRKSGYRLVAPVTPEPAEAGRILSLPATPVAESPHPAPPTIAPAASTRRRPRLAWLLPAAVLAAIALIGVSSWWIARGRAAAPRSVVLDAQPFTSYPGVERFPALSPDGSRVAFAWDGGTGGPSDLYVKQAGTEHPLRLTDDPEDKGYPAWSPDGGTIAFQRLGANGGVCAIPAIGGPEVRLATAGPMPPGLDWSPDGKQLAFAIEQGPGLPSRIMAFTPGEGTKHPLTFPPASCRGDKYPAFSPDGRWLAFVRTDSTFNEDIFLARLGQTPGAQARRLTKGQLNVFGLGWTPDGRSIVFGAVPQGKSRLWRLDVGSGALTWLVTPGERAVRPTISKRGRRMVYEEPTRTSGIYRLGAGPGGPTSSRPEAFIVSTQQESEARLSPDGGRIAFVSSRSGRREIWVCDREGTEARQVTDFQGRDVRRPCWSPDGRFLAFSGEVDGLLLVHVVSAEGGPPRLLARTDYQQLGPVWSSDPRWIHFVRGDARGTRVERVEVASGRVEAALDSTATLPVPSTDGRQLVFTDRTTGNLLSAPVGGGPKRLLLEWRNPGRPGQCVPVAEGIYLVWIAVDHRVLGFYRYATGRMETLYQFPPDCGGFLTVTPDGRTLLFDRVGLGGDLKVVDGFR